ncbi:hypothetical protein QZH41_001733 [Actinostola sp. cb2023]|nr:hypothetical protein QZH41_001733 [Actinostola sp. cb2023]
MTRTAPVLVIIVVLLQLSEAAEGANGYCKGKPNGNYPDPNNCNGYIACSNGFTYYMPCPANLKWNHAKKQCDWPRFGSPSCGDHPTAIPFECLGKNNGDYPDPDNCKGYITCSNGLTYRRPCPGELKWSRTKKRCDWPQYASGKCALKGCVDFLSPKSCGILKKTYRSKCKGLIGCNQLVLGCYGYKYNTSRTPTSSTTATSTTTPTTTVIVVNIAIAIAKRKDQFYSAVQAVNRYWDADELHDFTKRGDETEMKKDEPPTFCVLPPKPSHNTIYRPCEVSLAINEIKRLRSTYPHQITTTYISGNPGSGKSELARQIGEKYFDDVDNEVSLKFVTTFNASTLGTLIQSYMDLAIQLRCNEASITTIATSSDKLAQEEKLAHLKGFISPALQKYSSWLIIVDNVEDLQLVSRFIPLAGQKLHGQGHILVTTQDSQSIPPSDELTYHMPLSTGMRPDDAVRSLLSISGFDDGDDIVQQVAMTLDFQPLALACAGVYMRHARSTEPSMNWKKYIQKIVQGKRELTERVYEKTNFSYPKSMTNAVKMAVENEMAKNQVMLHTFQFLSLMAPEFISLEHVVNYVIKCLPDEDKESVAADIISSSLILNSEEKSKPTVRVHQVVYNVFRIIKLTLFPEAAGPNMDSTQQTRSMYVDLTFDLDLDQ